MMRLRKVLRRAAVLPILIPTPAPTITDIAPALGWSGTAGSMAEPAGWTVTTEAARTAAAAMPGLRPLYDTGGLCFDENGLVIGWHAYAGNASGRVDGTFEVLIEGNVYQLQLQRRARVDVNGDVKIEWGYFANLKHSAWTMNGSARVKVRYTPDDETQSPRVMGPYTYTRRPAGQLHDLTIDVTPSLADSSPARFNTIPKALNYARSQGAANPLIRTTETADYALLASALTAYTGGAGYATIRPNEGTIATFRSGAGAGVYTGGDSNISLKYNGLQFDTDRCRFDFGHINSLAPDSGVGSSPKDPIFNGVVFYNSFGRNHRYNLRRPSVLTYAENGSGAWAIARDVVAHDMLDAFHGFFSVLTQCEAYNIAEDICKGPVNIFGLKVYDVEGADIKAGTQGFTISKTGSNFFRLVKRTSGGNGAPLYVCDLQSSSNGSSWTTETTLNMGNHIAPLTVAAFVALVNGYGNGWSAAVVNDVYDAHITSFEGNPANTPPITGTSASTAGGSTLTVWSRFDVHGDVIQPGGGTFTDNNLFVNVIGVLDGSWQQWFYKLGTWRDCFMINYACVGATQGSVQGRAASEVAMKNCHFWHLTLDQTFAFSSTGPSSSDSYCSVKSSLFGHNTASVVVDVPANHAASFDGNHYCAGGAPSGASNSGLGSSLASLLDDPVAGLFSVKPLGGLFKRSRQVPFDALGLARSAMAYVGAVA